MKYQIDILTVFRGINFLKHSFKSHDGQVLKAESPVYLCPACWRQQKIQTTTVCKAKKLCTYISAQWFFLFVFIFTRTREVVLPKFKLEKTYNLIDYLRSMGIEELFNGKGDYSGISEEKITIDRVFTSHFTSSLIKLYHPITAQ